MRVVVDLSEEELRALKVVAQEDKMSQAEAVRQAIQAYLATRSAPNRESPAFGLWAGQTEGVAYQRALREEWSE
ncbi:MAG TPA: ribbon-helix-helix protein, CopG family [Gammaproteobacteria bacterium]|nr:ribbon-helix-helix protein, CopG family [Gammaproteobacteria bacterium]